MAAGLYDITNEILGKGHFAIVKLARHCLTGEHVAIKIVDKSKLTKEGLEQLSCEIKLWSILSRHEHPNVVKLYQCIDTRSKLYLVMEYCGNDVCDLYDHIQKKNDGNGLDEDEAKNIFRQICNAIFYCHSMKIVHRDLKPENILIISNHQESTTAVKLIDFGFSNQWCEDELLRTSCGSLAYSAPEILLGNQYDGPKVDIWSLGCILYILLYGHNPFMQFNDNETLIKILDCSFTTPEKPTVSELAIELIRGLLKKDPNFRLSIDEVMNHSWLKENNNFQKTTNSATSNSAKFSPNIETKKETSRFKNLVNEHIIDQMINQGIGLSKDVIKKILRNEHVDLTMTIDNTMKNTIDNETLTGKDEVNKVNNDTGSDLLHCNTTGNSVNDHHYIKATYHLLKDKSKREFRGIDANQQAKLRQHKRGNITTKRKDVLSRNNNNESIKTNHLTNPDSRQQQRIPHLSQNSQSLTSLDTSTSYVLPLARKCSIVSEEGSICTESNVAHQSQEISLSNQPQPSSLTLINATEQDPSLIDIFVTDASTSSAITPRMKTVQENNIFDDLSDEQDRSNNKKFNNKKESLLHPVSSSPDFSKTAELLNDDDNANVVGETNTSAIRKFCDLRVDDLVGGSPNKIKMMPKKSTILLANNSELLLPGVMIMMNNNSIIKKNIPNHSSQSPSNAVGYNDGDDISLVATNDNNCANNPQSSSQPSMRVIIQSKSLNNIAFVEHHPDGSSTNNDFIGDHDDYDHKHQTTKTTMTSSVSTVNIKSGQKADKNDCCSII